MSGRGGGGVGGAGGAIPDPLAIAINAVAGTMLLADIVKSNTPTLEDEVVVEVIGQPGATKQQLYFLALSAASSVVKQIAPLNPAVSFISPSAGMLMIEYDAADNWVRCTLKYQSGMAINYAVSIADSLPGTIFDRLAVYRGPSCDLNGAPYGFVATMGVGGRIFLAGLALIPGGAPVAGIAALLSELGTAGIPGSAAAPAPQLPFAGQPILTSCPTSFVPAPAAITQSPAPNTTLNAGLAGPVPSPNPKPPGDNRSRGAVIVPGPTVPTVPIGAGGSGQSGGSVGSSTNCCAQSLALIPLVFAALATPGINNQATFPDPVPGGLGG